MLQSASTDVRDDVEEALGDLLASPISPDGIEVHWLHVDAKMDRRIAWLPHNYVLTYRPHINGPPPHAGRHLVILAFTCLAELDLGP